MSRIGRKPIDIPAGVKITVTEDNVVTVEGPKGTLTQSFQQCVSIKIEGNQVIITRDSDDKFDRAIHGLTRSLINNMVDGVVKGFEKTLEINGIGYRAVKQGNNLVLSVGYSHNIEMVPPAGITVEVPSQTQIIIKGADKQVVGEFAAKIRSKRPPEPYKGKGIKYSTEFVRRKEGKTGGKGKK